jgi:hypothetical protein
LSGAGGSERFAEIERTHVGHDPAGLWETLSHDGEHGLGKVYHGTSLHVDE